MYDTVIVVPYRNRPTQLAHFVNVIAPRIQRHIPNSNVIIVEQYGNKLFNRGKLLNVGCLQYKNKTKSFIIHDIDLEPDDYIVDKYYKPELDIDNNEYIRGLYNNKIKTLGGIYKIDHDVYFQVNGHHNKIWGWGLEDQEFKNRITHYNYNVNYTTIRVDNGITPHFKNIFDNIANKEVIHNHQNIIKRFMYKNFKILTNETREQWIKRNGVKECNYKIYKQTNECDFVEKIIVII